MEDHEFDVETLLSPVTPLRLSHLKRPSDKSKRGFSLERFESCPRAEFQCRVCSGVVRDPRECAQCGLLLCTECVENEASFPRRRAGFYFMYRAREHHCPACDSDCPTREPSRLLKRLILSLKVYCKHREAGCQVVTALADVEDHQRACPFKPVHCSNNSCCHRSGRRDDFILIPSETPQRLFACSDICEKTIRMESWLKKGEVEKAVEEFHEQAKLLGTGTRALP